MNAYVQISGPSGLGLASFIFFAEFVVLAVSDVEL
jgi:hypothetical protein